MVPVSAVRVTVPLHGTSVGICVGELVVGGLVGDTVGMLESSCVLSVGKRVELNSSSRRAKVVGPVLESVWTAAVWCDKPVSASGGVARKGG